MRIVFMGTPDFAVPSLDALMAAGHEIVVVYSQPPRRSGRGKQVQPSPVHLRADKLGIPVQTPLTLRDPQAQADFAALEADVAVVAAYGLILPGPILDAPRLGCINVHASLLPRWRGAAPIQRAILAGDVETGVCIMQMEAGLDTGPVRATAKTPVDRKTAGELTAELAEIGAKLLVDVLADVGAHPPVPQPEDGVTYAAKIDKSEARLDFLVSAPQAERQIRASAPTPGAFFELAGERFRILEALVCHPRESGDPEGVTSGLDSRFRGNDKMRPGTVIDDQLTIACNPGAIRPTLVQRAGRAAMTPVELLRGYAIPAGTKLA